jgi:hypothetical protein
LRTRRPGKVSLASIARLLPVVDVIREFVGIDGSLVGKILSQVLADCFDSGDKASRSITLLKLLGRGVNYVMPKLLANHLVDAAVA